MTQDDESVVVTQADRDRAADYMAAVSAAQGKYDPVAMIFMDECCDAMPIVQSLAAHRIATERAQADRIAALEAERDEAIDNLTIERGVGQQQLDALAAECGELKARATAAEARAEAAEADSARLTAVMAERDEAERKNCLNWGPCSRMSARAALSEGQRHGG